MSWSYHLTAIIHVRGNPNDIIPEFVRLTKENGARTSAVRLCGKQAKNKFTRKYRERKAREMLVRPPLYYLTISISFSFQLDHFHSHPLSICHHSDHHFICIIIIIIRMETFISFHHVIQSSIIVILDAAAILGTASSIRIVWLIVWLTHYRRSTIHRMISWLWRHVWSIQAVVSLISIENRSIVQRFTVLIGHKQLISQSVLFNQSINRSTQRSN